ncbi:TetR/AcrR family transcriptional regulator [Thalassomonas actiniarum]|uniref:TetR/AcrR family transcriptional regulator n=1 Tax=Thalassomonas actiniarum TaxID=485447 RepID=UPI001F30B7A4|nr:TetR/AcrR family transcriptional regulator [Thalassomonas actiniarum]
MKTEINSKKLALIQTAMKLFYRKGIHAVGINEVLKVSGIAKKTLYHHFSSKDDLILACLHYREQLFIDWFKQQLDAVPAGKAAILAIFDALDSWFNNRSPAMGEFNGCFFINASAEYGREDSLIYAACQQHKSHVRAIIKPHVDAFEADENKSNQLTDSLCLLKEGAITTAKVQAKLSAARDIKPLAASLINHPLRQANI